MAGAAPEEEGRGEVVIAPENAGEETGAEPESEAGAPDPEDAGQLGPWTLEVEELVGRGDEARTRLAAGAPRWGEERGASQSLAMCP